MITFENGIDGRAREPKTPTVAKFHTRKGEYQFCVIGTEYGYIHTSTGCVRLWKSYSGARRAARNYRSF